MKHQAEIYPPQIFRAFDPKNTGNILPARWPRMPWPCFRFSAQKHGLPGVGMQYNVDTRTVRRSRINVHARANPRIVADL
jgi:hypothetical protein